jgi:hypothetical protein
VLGKLDAFAKQRYVSPMEFAWIYFALEQTEQGFRWLTKASEDRAFELIHLKVDARFDPPPRRPPIRCDHEEARPGLTAHRKDISLRGPSSSTRKNVAPLRPVAGRGGPTNSRHRSDQQVRLYVACRRRGD